MILLMDFTKAGWEEVGPTSAHLTHALKVD
jgi:hypothetical protein